MHDNDDSQPRVLTTAEEDDRDQSAVLALVLAAHPGQFTVSELISELVQGKADFPQTDRFERAVGELVGVGLLHREHDTIRPTRAALWFDRLQNS
jgi:hypothetical protein